MGARLVREAETYALPNLRTHAARVALVVMALRAKDDDPAPRYFAGSAHLARALGYAMDDDNGARAVRRALSELTSLRYIEQVSGLPRRWKRHWLLTLPGPGSPTSASSTSSRQSARTDAMNVAQQETTKGNDPK